MGGVEAVHLSNLWAVKALKNYAWFQWAPLRAADSQTLTTIDRWASHTWSQTVPKSKGAKKTRIDGMMMMMMMMMMLEKKLGHCLSSCCCCCCFGEKSIWKLDHQAKQEEQCTKLLQEDLPREQYWTGPHHMKLQEQEETSAHPKGLACLHTFL